MKTLELRSYGGELPLAPSRLPTFLLSLSNFEALTSPFWKPVMIEIIKNENSILLKLLWFSINMPISELFQTSNTYA